jgi:DNA-binding NtrC family response regulator
MSKSVLLVDDDDASLRLLERFFRRLGWEPHATKSPQESIVLYETLRPYLVILDLQMPKLSGIDLLQILRDRDPDSSIVMLTGHADVESAVTAMRMGAQNYLTKPISLDHLEAVAAAAMESTTIRRRNRVLSSQQIGQLPTGEAIPSSTAFRDLDERIDRLSEVDATILLQGETGTGKGWLAKRIHGRSARSAAPLIEVDCAQLSGQNLEQRLFGAERMTNRGRRVDPRGMFEIANGGTILLDRIELLNQDLQPKLLGFLATKKFRRAGGETEVEVDVRIVAAAAVDMEEEIRQRRFREDLYYRLAVFPLRIPPLRERSRAEISELANYLLHVLREGRSDSPAVRISPEADDLLGRYSWPGNVREMRNVLERLLILHPNAAQIGVDQLPPEIRGGGKSGELSQDADPTLPLDEVERRHIWAALQHFDGNKSRVAASLRIGRRTLYDKLAKYGLE